MLRSNSSGSPPRHARAEFAGSLGARDGVSAKQYKFAVRAISTTSGSYSAAMRTECNKYGMKPVCDHRNYCKNDGGALYLGQAHHISYPPHRNINSWFPTGWSSIRSNWNGLCNYAANAHGNHALCNMPTNTHSWRTPAQANPGFVCGKASSETPPSFCPPACLFVWHCPVPDLPVGWECTIRHGM